MHIGIISCLSPETLSPIFDTKPNDFPEERNTIHHSLKRSEKDKTISKQRC